MRAIVTVFKSELEERDFVTAGIKSLCRQVLECEDAIVFCPIDSKIVELLSILRFHKIAYGTHFDTAQRIEVTNVGATRVR